MDGPSAQGFLGLTGPLAPRVAVAADAADKKKGRGWRRRLCKRIVKEKVQKVQRVVVSPLCGNAYKVSVTGLPSRPHLRAFCIECASRPKLALSLHIKGPSFYLADRPS